MWTFQSFYILTDVSFKMKKLWVKVPDTLIDTYTYTHARMCTYRADCWMKSTPVHNFFLEGSDQPITCSNWQQCNKVHAKIIWSNGFCLLICFQSHIWTNLTLLLSQAFVTAHLTHTHTHKVLMCVVTSLPLQVLSIPKEEGFLLTELSPGFSSEM